MRLPGLLFLFQLIVLTGKAAVPDTGNVAALHKIPVLCYHQVREWTVRDSKSARAYIVPVQLFKDEMKWLHDNGYHTILPAALINHCLHGTALPSKPVLLTFDDGTESQCTAALPELDKYGFKAVFFIMTVTLDRPNFMTRQQVKALPARGHIVGCHTWDHHRVTSYTARDWETQLTKPTQVLQQLTGQPMQYFAYPFGLWNAAAIPQLKAHGYIAAFQLAGRPDANSPLLTIPRRIADGNWTIKQFATVLSAYE